MPSPCLSKSRILSGLQCPKRLWLEVYRPDLAEVKSQPERAFATGHQVGEIARRLWPTGNLIEHDQELWAALVKTKDWLKRLPQVTLFEATLRHNGVLVRVDVLDAAEVGDELVEVKAAASVKDYHIDDCAVQTWVVNGAGRRVQRVRLAHVDTRFVYPGGEDYSGLLAIEDITQAVRDRLPLVPQWVLASREALAVHCPKREVGSHCSTPIACPFLGHCTPPPPEYPVTLLPRGGRVVAELLSEGIIDVRDIPEGRLASANHERVRRLTVLGQPELRPALVAFLNSLPYPRYYLDFETVRFAVPIWVGTRPYEQLPFQWSCHIQHTDGRIEHREFLDTTGADPMRPCAEGLLQDLGDTGPILMYSSFERQILLRLQRACPDLAQGLQGLIDRLVDLLPAVREGYYHPDQKGSWSIKQVLPTVAPELSYAELVVRDGLAAGEAYLELIEPDTSKTRMHEPASELRAYCGLDTLAMLRLVERFTSVREDEPIP